MNRMTVYMSSMQHCSKKRKLILKALLKEKYELYGKYLGLRMALELELSVLDSYANG